MTGISPVRLLNGSPGRVATMSLNMSLILAPLAVWLILAMFGMAFGDGADLSSGDSDGGDG